MPTNIHQRALGPGARLVGSFSVLIDGRLEFKKLAKCCMHGSKSISDLGYS